MVEDVLVHPRLEMGQKTFWCLGSSNMSNLWHVQECLVYVRCFTDRSCCKRGKKFVGKTFLKIIPFFSLIGNAFFFFPFLFIYFLFSLGLNLEPPTSPPQSCHQNWASRPFEYHLYKYLLYFLEVKDSKQFLFIFFQGCCLAS